MTSSLPFTLRARQEAAMRLRLSEASGRRWLWAAGCALPVLGLPLLLWHGRRHRTLIPFLYGLTTQAIGAFLLATVARARRRRPAMRSPGCGWTAEVACWGWRAAQKESSVWPAKRPA